MDAFELLLNRRSSSRLTEPAPAGEALDLLLRAGMSAPRLAVASRMTLSVFSISERLS